MANLKLRDPLIDGKPLPRIYVACLASYANGLLYGKWINAAQGRDALVAEVKQLLANSPESGAEEYMVHDFEGFYALKIDAYESLEDISQKAQFILAHGALGAALIHHFHDNIEAAEAAMDENYRGEYASELDYAIHLFDEFYLNSIPEQVHSYVNYEQFKTNIFMGDYFSIEVQGRCHIFENF